MKKGIICVLVCMLMILTTVIPISGTIFTNESSHTLMKENTQYVKTEKIVNELKVKLDKVSTKQEALTLIKEVIVQLNNNGLLPKGMTVKRAQRLVTNYFLRAELVQPSQRNNENNFGNTNCLVIGITNWTYFRPYPALVMDIPFLYNLAFNSSLRNITCFLGLPYLFRLLQPFKFGPYVEIGGRTKLVEYENITDDISPSSGLILTYGSNGFNKWAGAFFGSLDMSYKKFSYDNSTSLELWEPVGMVGFNGINLLSVVSLNQNIPMVYIGFAREVNFTYSPLWT